MTVAKAHPSPFARFLNVSPSPYHAASDMARRLTEAGFKRLHTTTPWGKSAAGRYFTESNGSIAAWVLPASRSRKPPAFRILAAHTDSPGIRLKPKPEMGKANCMQLAVEPYGAPILYTWFDRPLGLAGRVTVANGTKLKTHLLDINEALLVIPSLAIHMQKPVNDDGFKINMQTHLPPIWGLGATRGGAFTAVLSDYLKVDLAKIRGTELWLRDLQPAIPVGISGGMIQSPRLDNLSSCHAALEALLGHVAEGVSSPYIPMTCFFNDEEHGSRTADGAGSPFLEGILERIVGGYHAGPDTFRASMARSFLLSADATHAAHPNFLDKHEPGHQVLMGNGPATKTHSNQGYVTNAPGMAMMVEAFVRANTPLQHFVFKSDAPAGSTIGPVIAARLGIPTADIGIGIFAMHSARETGSEHDVNGLTQGMRQILLLDLPV